MGTALTRLCPPYGNGILSPSRRLQRLRRVDVEKRAVAFDGDFGHRLAVFRDQVPRTDIAVERHQFSEEAARPQHGITAATVGDGHYDEIAAVGREGAD